MHAAIEVARELPPDKTVLVILPDGGRPYLSKIFDDAWMIENGMMERTGDGPTVGELLREKGREAPALPAMVSVQTTDQVGAAVDLFQRYGISQLPVVRKRDSDDDGVDLSAIVGSVHERDILERVFRDADATRMPVSAVMGAPLGVIRADASVEDVYGDLQERPAVVVADGAQPVGVLTRADLLEYLAHRSRV